MNLKLLFIISFSIFIIHAAIDIKPDIEQAQEALKMRSTIAISILKELSIFSLRLQFGELLIPDTWHLWLHYTLEGWNPYQSIVIHTFRKCYPPTHWLTELNLEMLSHLKNGLTRHFFGTPCRLVISDFLQISLGQY